MGKFLLSISNRIVLLCCFLFMQVIMHAQYFDRSGKFYPTVRIGNQTWMAKNLDVSTFRNGDPIPEAKTSEEWSKAGYEKKPAWCYYNNDPANGQKYGKLYNSYAVNDPRGLAAPGWHVSSMGDWDILLEFCKVITYTLRGTYNDAGIKLKSTTGWVSGYSTNSSGFTALPGGSRSGGAYKGLGSDTYMWTSDFYYGWNCTGGCNREKLIWTAGDVRTNLVSPSDPKSGMYVRCLRDDPPSSTSETIDPFWGKVGGVLNYLNDFTGIPGDGKLLKIDGPTFKISSQHANSILECKPEESENGSAWAGVFEGWEGDHWQLIPSEITGYYYMTSVKTGLVMETASALTGAAISMKKLKKNPALRLSQRVKIIEVPGEKGYYYLQFQLSDLYIRWKNLITVDGLLSSVPAIPVSIIARHSGKAIDVWNANKELGGKIQQYPSNKTPAQIFSLVLVGSGYHSIKNVNSGMCLDVQNGLPNNGQPVWQYIDNKTPAQLFKPVHVGNGFFQLESKLNSNLVITVQNGSEENGAALVITPKDGSTKQHFFFQNPNAKIDQGILINPALTSTNIPYKFKIENSGEHIWTNKSQ